MTLIPGVMQGPGSCECRQPPCMGVALRLDREEPQEGTEPKGSGRCSSFLCGRIRGSSPHQGSEKSHTGTGRPSRGPSEAEPRADRTAVVGAVSLAWGGWRCSLPQAPPATARLHSGVCSLIHSTNPVPRVPGETLGL